MKILYKRARWLFDIVVAMRLDSICYADEAIRARNIIENKYSIAPAVSKVRNMGYDSTGTHCSDDNGVHAMQEIDESDSFTEIHLVDVKNLDKKYQKYFGKGLIVDAKSLIKYLILRKRLKG